MSGPCAKQVVTCKIVCSDGSEFIGRNDCDNPQEICPRIGMMSGEGYELCISVCGQRGHAEIQAIRLAGAMTAGGRAEISGHSYICENCNKALADAGIASIAIK